MLIPETLEVGEVFRLLAQSVYRFALCYRRNHHLSRTDGGVHPAAESGAAACAGPMVGAALENAVKVVAEEKLLTR